MNYFNYYTEIEDTFVRRRGKHLFLSPIDWALIETWQERGIPLNIVLRAIESVFDVFDKQPVGTRTIKSLFYCREEVESQFKEWTASQVGKSPDENENTASMQFEPQAIREYITAAVDSLKQIPNERLKEALERAVARLEALSAELGSDLETIDGVLGDIEKMLDIEMQSNWDAEHLKHIKKELDSQLRTYKSDMDADAYRQTYDLMLLKRLRDESGMPRLGLFYL